jgi:ANTAR domain
MPASDPGSGPGLHLDRGHGSRIQTLLASVQDIASSLNRLSAQLDRELELVPPTDPVELQRLQAEVAQLRGSQDARMVIEQAKGMLMAGRRCSDQEAFDVLVAMSQAERRKVREIAAEIVTAAVAGETSGTGETSGPEQVAARVTPANARPGMRIDLDGAGGQVPVGR